VARLTPEMEQKILQLYAKDPNYKHVAEQVRKDERTVRRVVNDNRKSSLLVSKEASRTPDRHQLNSKVVSANRDSADTHFEIASANNNKNNNSSRKNLSEQQAQTRTETESSAAAATASALPHSPNMNFKEDNEVIKILFTDFVNNEKPWKIVAKHGRPDLVELHYKQFNRMRKSDIETIQSEFLDEYHAYELKEY